MVHARGGAGMRSAICNQGVLMLEGIMLVGNMATGGDSLVGIASTVEEGGMGASPSGSCAGGMGGAVPQVSVDMGQNANGTLGQGAVPIWSWASQRVSPVVSPIRLPPAPWPRAAVSCAAQTHSTMRWLCRPFR